MQRFAQGERGVTEAERAVLISGRVQKLISLSSLANTHIHSICVSIRICMCASACSSHTNKSLDKSKTKPTSISVYNWMHTNKWACVCACVCESVYYHGEYYYNLVSGRGRGSGRIYWQILKCPQAPCKSNWITHKRRLNQKKWWARDVQAKTLQGYRILYNQMNRNVSDYSSSFL